MTSTTAARRGAYELIAADDDAAAVSLFATGSEVAIAVAAKKLLAARKDFGAGGLGAVLRAFARRAGKPSARRSSARARVNVAVEAGIRQGWDAIIGSGGAFVGMTGFGASAPYKELYQHFGITAEKVAEAAAGRL